MNRIALPDGYTAVAPGRIAAVATYLEMTTPRALAPRELPSGVAIRHEAKPDLDWYRRLFRKVGEHWLWFSRLEMSDAELVAVLSDPLVEVRVLEVDCVECGLLELDLRDPADVELSFLGLTPDRMAKGLGGHLMETAIQRVCRNSPPPRFWLHTCTFDHPTALGFYMKYGFKPYRQVIEVKPDPRLSGLLPRSAAPQIPIIGD
ncbi:MAG TPA: GNAT family N-acetyltransferase [Bryobacteraceae bacterium]|nr:GNAT family N-acetyltransferase [Bryobacteraceae bacterium]